MESKNHRLDKRKTHGVNFIQNLHMSKTSMESKPSLYAKRGTKRMVRTYVLKERKLWRTMEKLKLWKPLMMENKLKRNIISLTKKVNKLKRLNKSKNKVKNWLSDYYCSYFFKFLKIILIIFGYIFDFSYSFVHKICYFFRKAKTFGNIVYLRLLKSSLLKLLSTYPATISGSLDLGRSIPRCNLLKSFPPIEAIIDLIPLCPLKSNKILLSTSFLFDSYITKFML